MVYDSFLYMTALFQSSTNHSEILEWLDLLTGIVRDKQKSIQSLPSSHIRHILQQHHCPTPLIDLIEIMMLHKTLTYLPRVTASYRRHLKLLGHSVIDVTFDTDTVSLRRQVTESLPAQSIIVFHTDRNLIAGIKIATQQSVIDYNIDALLTEMEVALQKGSS